MSDNSSASSARDRYLPRAGDAGGGGCALLQGERSRDVQQSWPHPALQGGKFDDKKWAVRLQELIKEDLGIARELYQKAADQGYRPAIKQLKALPRQRK
jgi:hypothetical protein